MLINIIKFVDSVLFSFVIAEIFICNNYINGFLSLAPLAKSCSFVLRYMEALSKGRMYPLIVFTQTCPSRC